MALPDGLDSWSPVAALAALTLGTILALARPTLPVRLALVVGTAIFAAGVFVAVREAIPSYNRLLGAYAGVFGLARVVGEGWTPMRVVLILIGLGAGLNLARRRLVGRSVRST
jgi:hypothetical protein